MTPSKLLGILLSYKTSLKANPPVRLSPEQQEGGSVGPEATLNHLTYMVDEAVQHATHGKFEKALRWLGFVQGVMWCMGLRTLAELRADNRSTRDDLS